MQPRTACVRIINISHVTHHTSTITHHTSPAHVQGISRVYCIRGSSLRAVPTAAAAPRIPVQTLCHVTSATSAHTSHDTNDTHVTHDTHDTSGVTCNGQQLHDAIERVRGERRRHVRVAADVPVPTIKFKPKTSALVRGMISHASI